MSENNEEGKGITAQEFLTKQYELSLSLVESNRRIMQDIADLNERMDLLDKKIDMFSEIKFESPNSETIDAVMNSEHFEKISKRFADMIQGRATTL